MKKKTLLMLAISASIMVGCGNMQGLLNGGGATNAGTSTSMGNNLLGSLLGNGEATTNSLTNLVLGFVGADKVTDAQMQGTWRYYEPGIAFTSENLLAKAGGEMAANQLKQKVKQHYATLGINASNTNFTFNKGNFSGSVMNIPLQGTYKLNEKTGELTMNMMLLNINASVKRNGTNGISILFDAKKLMILFKALAAKSSNTTLNSISKLTSSIDGMRVGFDLAR